MPSAGVALPLKDGVDDGLTVDGVADSLTNLQIIGGTILVGEVEEIVEAGHGRTLMLDQIGISVDLSDVVGLNAVSNVDFAHLQSDDALRCFGDDLHDEIFGCWLTHEVIVKGLKFDGLRRIPLDHFIRAGSDGMLGEILVAVGLNIGFGHDGREGHGEVVQNQGIRFGTVDDDGIVAGNLHALNEADDIVDIVGGNRSVERPLDILNRQIAAVVELDALTDGEFPILVIELLIALG